MDLFYGEDYPRRQDALFAVSCTLTAVAAIAVLLRCIGRFILIRMPGPDDYFLIAAMLGVIGYLIGMFVAKGDHMGFPASNLTPANMVNFFKEALAIQIIYSATLASLKTSICFAYLRFAVTTKFRYLCIGTIVVHAVFFLVCFIIFMFECQPLEKVWDVTGTVKGTCINNTAFFYASSGFHIMTDVWILLLPIHTLKKIRRPRREKAALFCVFGAGAFATTASCIRLHTIYIYTLSDDPFRDAVPVNLWTMIETSIAVVCASVPGLKPIFSRAQHHRARETNSQNKGGSKLPDLLRRRELRAQQQQQQQQQQYTDGSFGGLLGDDMTLKLTSTPATWDLSLPLSPGAFSEMSLSFGGGGHGNGLAGSGAGDIEKQLTASDAAPSGHSSQERTVGGPQHVNMSEPVYPPGWPLGSPTNVWSHAGTKGQ
ncbi:hypothetical protein MAPG_09587 [Magnaporthiopsis poae ATCC 64411]|uniref:Rhodopsin domain-containing protein n=1 Tax=Magnaporthiopsis poae (strain ATCC 64411 / 73-15) TaxID=644358 RepID=A0A0C4EAC1_MAGP6|nr:hypothetical protein MAPG_09587 [Magnaporthiopsis poae ATCC 64411]